MGIALSGTAHLFCTPERPSGVSGFDPAWRTENVATLAKGILVDYAFDRFPILADALEEAGCTDPILLKHCRDCTKHLHSCWVLTCISGRPGPMPTQDITDLQLVATPGNVPRYMREENPADAEMTRMLLKGGGVVLLVGALIAAIYTSQSFMGSFAPTVPTEASFYEQTNFKAPKVIYTKW
jgi:hypothetical protein